VASVGNAPSVEGAIGGTPAGSATGFAGTGANVAGGVTGMPAGVPSVDGAAGSMASGAPAAPEVSSFTSAPDTVAGKFSTGAAVDAAGAGEAVSRTESARGSVDSAQAAAADPSGAAEARVGGAVSERAPVDPSAMQAKAGFASSAVDNPEAAAADQVHVGVDTQTSSTGASVQVEGSVSKPSVDPKR
jgi:hypothetical protein